ncbi:MAG: TonB family protein [Ginsengibacter sp.]
MNQQAILQSNLLDIIFENRNKDYGAYKLRKTYQGRLSVAVLSTAGLALMLSLFFVSHNSSEVLTRVHSGTLIPGTKISSMNQLPKPENKKIEKRQAAVKGISKRITGADRPPFIVAFTNINTLPATPAEIQPSFTSVSTSGINLEPDADGTGGSDETAVTIKTNLPEPDKSTPVAVAEIIPQYPGGIQALLSFLKKNIHPPASVEEGRDVSVKIAFVVNFDGSLKNFTVAESGGEIFDNEVLRVLKKMGLWIPGKNKGKNVAVYYTVPVKFTSEF